MTSRRRALWLLGAAGLAALSADGVRQGAASTRKAAPPPDQVAQGRPVVHATPTPTPTPTPRPPAWTQSPLTAVKTPIRELTDLSPAPPPNTIALTIDDGPHPVYTPKVLDVLAEHQVTATFFIIGEQVKEFPRLARRIADAGHQVCNHTMTHPLSMTSLSSKRLRKEIGEAHDRIAQVTGIVPTFFRSPGGAWSQRVLDITAEHDMLPVDWAVDPRDWTRPGVARIRRTLVGSKAGNIMLCHDGGGDRSQTVAALRKAIPALKKRGLTFVAL
ncbi:polysaccharide deacetylase family protein [Actinomadura miaoliensis]